jgi:hypothetical protein
LHTAGGGGGGTGGGGGRGGRKGGGVGEEVSRDAPPEADGLEGQTQALHRHRGIVPVFVGHVGIRVRSRRHEGTRQHRREEGPGPQLQQIATPASPSRKVWCWCLSASVSVCVPVPPSTFCVPSLNVHRPRF